MRAPWLPSPGASRTKSPRSPNWPSSARLFRVRAVRLISQPATQPILLALRRNLNKTGTAALTTLHTWLVHRTDLQIIHSFMLLLSVKLQNVHNVHCQYKTPKQNQNHPTNKFPKCFAVAAICNPEVLCSSAIAFNNNKKALWKSDSQLDREGKNCIPTRSNLINIYIQSSRFFGQNTAKIKLIRFFLVKKTYRLGHVLKSSLCWIRGIPHFSSYKLMKNRNKNLFKKWKPSVKLKIILECRF